MPHPVLWQSPLPLEATMLAALARGDTTLTKRLHAMALWSITYASGDLTISGMLAHPRQPGRYPCLIYNRGGTGNSGLLTPDDAATHLSRIADWGYLVIASQYRSTADAFGGSDIDDVLNLLPVLDILPYADSSRIGMWGWSRGGLMTYRAVTLTARISAAIIVAGVADAFDYVARRPDMEQEVFLRCIPGYQQQRDTALTLRSAIRWPQQLCKHTPLLLLHGSADWRVHPSQSLRMAGALLEEQHPCRLVLLEGGDHALTEYTAEMYALARAWLDRYVRDRRPWPHLEPHGV